MSEERLQELYLEAADLAGDEQHAFLRRVRETEPALAGELELLLGSTEAEPSPIDRPIELAGLAASATGAPRPAPRQVGPYRIVRELGQGGMGRVFLAEQETPDFRRTVALKLIDHPRFDVEMVRRFRDEVRILASLEHPGIVRFYDGGKSAEGIWFLALEFVEGADLLVHARERELDVRERVELVLAVARAVAYAHGKGVVHRDIKPGNVLVGRDGEPRLLDFGISKLLDPGSASALTTTGSGFRPMTPAYASPEQLAGGAATTASDVYSLGVVLYELLCGERPSPASGAPEPPSRMARRTTSEARAPRPRPARRDRIDRRLDAICLQALAADPAARYPDAEAFAGALERYLEGRGAAGGSRRRYGLLAAALAILAALAVGSFIDWRALSSRLTAKAPAATAATSGRPGLPFDPYNPPPIEEAEAKFAAAPDDVVAGAALAFRLGRNQRSDEALLVVGRLRQIPGHEHDPLIDFTEGALVHRQREHQRALIVLTRARDGALAQNRTELLAEIHGLRGSVLSKLGQRDAAIADLELALAEGERSGDALFCYRTLNDLALERLQRGETAEGQALLERALVEAKKADVRPLVVLGNLAALHGVRGRPDLAEARLQELLELRKLEPSRLREAQTWMKLSLAQRDLGRVAASDASIDQAVALLEPLEKEPELANALYFRAVADLDSARFDRLDDQLAAIRKVTHETLDRRALGYDKEIEGRRAALAGDLAAARLRFGESRQIFAAQGDADFAARTALVWAEAELAAEEPAAALGVLDVSKVGEGDASADESWYFARALRARALADEGNASAAHLALDSLGADAASSPSFLRRFAWFAARGKIAAIEGRHDAARADLELARDAALQSGRRAAAIEMRLELAELAGAPGSGTELGKIEREARELGLEALARRANAAGARLGVSPTL